MPRSSRVISLCACFAAPAQVYDASTNEWLGGVEVTAAPASSPLPVLAVSAAGGLERVLASMPQALTLRDASLPPAVGPLALQSERNGHQLFYIM